MTTPVPQPTQQEPRIPQRVGLTVKELLHWQSQFGRLDISLHDADRLCCTIRSRAYIVYTENEAVGVTASGAKLFETPPRPELRQGIVWPPNNVRVPRHHEMVTYRDFAFVLPTSSVGEHFYVVTQGTLVGVFLHWTRAAPFAVKVKGAVYAKVDTLNEGAQLMLDAIDDGLAKYLGAVVLP
ncbi:hypothetical protein JVT61DRAFT_14688 [Boletus reticuloceps]|uniref:Uncharacterized protein n=1 Tax=Boletus reticuloceps TaxID=495285 RepID=A0A8I2YRQ9_9AGAM|nr:hypothetical protein JVT61DRAFT_14688 [Boletus reticuloceps]